MVPGRSWEGSWKPWGLPMGVFRARLGAPWEQLGFPMAPLGGLLGWLGGSWGQLLVSVGGSENIEKKIFFIVFLRFGSA